MGMVGIEPNLMREDHREQKRQGKIIIKMACFSKKHPAKAHS